MPRHREAHAIGRDETARGFHAACHEPLAPDPGDLAMLNDIHAGGGGRARIAPGHGVVTHGTAAWLQKTTQHGVAAIVEIDQRNQGLDLFAVERQCVHRQQPHAIGAARKQVTLRFGVEQVQRAALADHGIEVQSALKPFPQLQGVIVETHIFRPEVVGADDRRVAPDVAQANRALLDDGHVADPEFGGEVVGGRQPLAAGSDNNHLVARTRARLVPRARPATMAKEPFPEQSRGGIPTARCALRIRMNKAIACTLSPHLSMPHKA